MKNKFSAALAFVAAILLLSGAVAAETEASATDVSERSDAGRLRVGLVLGGGGARGAAHIGVLQELERLQIPIDAIVGTSMGAIVGGLYASGMSSAELEELVATLDWADALRDSPSRSDLRFRRKQDDEQFPINLELGLSDGQLQLPQGAIQGQKLDLLLRELTLDVSHIDDFDDLGIPFRAVASDLVTGRPYVMGEGDLAVAIRASMSVPGAIAPVAIDDSLLVDGGLVGNLGVDIMQQMDVDVIIAVDVEFPLYRLEELTSALAISEQVLTILIRNETLRQIERLSERDVLIRPELGHFESTDFTNSVDALEPGIDATRAQVERLSQLALDATDYERYVESRSPASRSKSTIDFVRVVHDSKLSPEFLKRQMHLQPGDPLDPQAIAREANRLYGLRVFERVGYRLVEDDGNTGVEFSAISRTWGDTILMFGIGIEDDFEGSTAFNLSTRFLTPAINKYGAEWRTDLTVGTTPRFSSEFYHPLGLDSRVFIAPRLQLGQRNIDVFTLDQAAARLRVTEAEFGLDFGLELDTWGEFRVGAYRGAGDARVKVGDPTIPNFDFDIGGAFASLRFDSFDDANFPRGGSRGGVRWDMSRRGLGADNNYEVLALDFNTAWSRGKSTLLAGVDFATTWDADTVVQAYFPLGGFLRLSGLERGQLSGPHAGVARLVVYRRIGSSAGGLIEVPTYFGASLEAGNVWQDRDAISVDDLRTNGSLFFGLDTYIGPVFLAAGLGEGGDTNFYLFIGALPD